ncbi:unnamed protein product [Brassica oleracea var. botrytis]|uniref:DUF4283 domain-containing protein n=1 Tax=Brassica oleracea TaxID=3712 RepID=A0A3P6BMZ5_BRAOL|nr:unnamed protein product [Brassica oleracea]
MVGTSFPINSTVLSPSAKTRSENTIHFDLENFKVLPQKNSSPIQLNKASNSSSFAPPKPNSEKLPKISTNPTVSDPNPPTSVLPPNLNPKTSTFEIPNPNTTSSENPPPATPSIAEKLRKFEDKTLRRLASVTISDTGRPRVLTPDSVFQKGAELHKDFIICYFNGRPPPFNHIQNVLNSLWGKGIRVEIHKNPLSRSMLVRIPSEYLRQKILEKRVWYQQGLSLVAGLIGEPKETDEFTLNLVSLTTSHVKVVVDLTKLLPDVVEFTRQSGEVVEQGRTHVQRNGVT